MNSTRRTLLAGLAVGAVMAIIAPAITSPANAQDVKIGILVPGSQTDKGFMQSAYGGAKKV